MKTIFKILTLALISGLNLLQANPMVASIARSVTFATQSLRITKNTQNAMTYALIVAPLVGKFDPALKKDLLEQGIVPVDFETAKTLTEKSLGHRLSEVLAAYNKLSAFFSLSAATDLQKINAANLYLQTINKHIAALAAQKYIVKHEKSSRKEVPMASVSFAVSDQGYPIHPKFKSKYRHCFEGGQAVATKVKDMYLRSAGKYAPIFNSYFQLGCNENSKIHSNSGISYDCDLDCATGKRVCEFAASFSANLSFSSVPRHYVGDHRPTYFGRPEDGFCGAGERKCIEVCGR